MKITNRLYSSFGPFAAISGKLIFAIGLFTLQYSWMCAILILLGSFLGFTQSRTTIDATNKRIRFSEILFGFIPTGKWIALTSDMKLDIQHATYAWRVYSKSNRSHDFTDAHFRIMLFDSKGFEIMPIQKSTNKEELERDLQTLCEALQLARLRPNREK